MPAGRCRMLVSAFCTGGTVGYRGVPTWPQAYAKTCHDHTTTTNHTTTKTFVLKRTRHEIILHIILSGCNTAEHRTQRLAR